MKLHYKMTKEISLITSQIENNIEEMEKLDMTLNDLINWSVHSTPTTKNKQEIFERTKDYIQTIFPVQLNVISFNFF